MDDEARELKRQLEGWARALYTRIVGGNLSPAVRWAQAQQIAMLIQGLNRDPGDKTAAQVELDRLNQKFGPR